MKANIMNIKKNVWALAAALLFTTAFTNCSDWTEVEAENKVDYGNTEPARPESYYEALREWKKSDHSVSFGWFSSWNEPATSTTGMLMGIPDSMDIVSLWGGWSNLSPGRIEDLRMVREKKGTKVVICIRAGGIGASCTPPEHNADAASREAFWEWPREASNMTPDKLTPEMEAQVRASLAKYARAIRDTIYKYDYDGFDFDLEPPAVLATYAEPFIEEMSKLIGPQSNSDKMFIIDGYFTDSYFRPELCTSFNYLVTQSYAVSGGTPQPDASNSMGNMDSRLNRTIGRFSDYLSEEEITNRFIVTENLESAIDCLNGGFYWRTRDYVRLDKKVCPSLLGMALWEPLNGYRKGGFGGYRFDGESANKPSYKWMRRAIQSQNPAVN